MLIIVILVLLGIVAAIVSGKKDARSRGTFLFVLGSIVAILSVAIRYGDWGWKTSGAVSTKDIPELYNLMTMV